MLVLLQDLVLMGQGGLLLVMLSQEALQGFATTLQVIEGTSATTSSLQLVRNSNSVDPPYINFGKSRATATGGVTAVANNDLLGEISWTAADGTDLSNVAATIRAKASAAAIGNSTPARLEFLTTTSGSGDATERLRIDHNGNIIIANSGGTLYTNTAGTSNFRAGVNAGNSIASGGNYNTVVGDREAGTAITTGDGMVAIGYQALMTEDAQRPFNSRGCWCFKNCKTQMVRHTTCLWAVLRVQQSQLAYRTHLSVV